MGGWGEYMQPVIRTHITNALRSALTAAAPGPNCPFVARGLRGLLPATAQSAQTGSQG